jgi:hypothetical protein
LFHQLNISCLISLNSVSSREFYSYSISLWWQRGWVVGSWLEQWSHTHSCQEPNEVVRSTLIISFCLFFTAYFVCMVKMDDWYCCFSVNLLQIVQNHLASKVRGAQDFMG